MKKLLTIIFLINLATHVNSQQEFEAYQSIFTHGANDFQSFEIAGETYLAVAHFTNNDSEEISSSIYHWQDGEFHLFQEIPTAGASDWEFFEIEGIPYLAVANYQDNTTNEVNSVIYRWDGDQFIDYQSIPTVGAYDWEFFEIEGVPYLVVANQANGEDTSINSTIYQWDGSNFQAHQFIPCMGATDWQSFTIGGEVYLAIANVLAINTSIYRWEDVGFVLHQTLPFTLATTGIETFVIDAQWYLATASGSGAGTYNSISKVYLWQEDSFIQFQDLPTVGAFDWEYFNMNGEHYLVVANYKESEDDFTQNSEIFKWNGTSFESFQAILTHGAVDWEYLELAGASYLVVAEYKNNDDHNINSRVFRFEDNLGIFTDTARSFGDIQVFPNPMTTHLSVIVPEREQLIAATVYTTSGELVKESQTESISFTSMSSGMYIMVVETDKNRKEFLLIKD